MESKCVRGRSTMPKGEMENDEDRTTESDWKICLTSKELHAHMDGLKYLVGVHGMQ